MRDVLSNIPVDALRVFETAARLNSFTRAADQLGMTQAAVSWRIRDLEERLGHALFVRRPRAIELTEHGERLNHAAGEAMNLLNRRNLLYRALRTGQPLIIEVRSFEL